MVRKISQSATPLAGPVLADIRDVAQSAGLIAEAMPDLPVLYGVLVDGIWNQYPTQGFLAAVGLGRQEFEELSPQDLAQMLDLDRVNRWASETERAGPLVFLADNGHQINRWLELHLARVGDVASANFYMLSDVDVEVRLEKENQKSMGRLDAQLRVLSSALDASPNGFAIWRAVRNPTGDIVSFTLVFMNEAGAAPTGTNPRHLVGGTIEDVLGRDQSEDLTRLFALALNEHSVQSKVVQIESPAGWVGAYLTEAVPFDEDQIIDSFRDVSEEQRERDRLNWLAQHDHLTGLPNRRNLEEILQQSLNHVRDTQAFVAFAFVDIDNFKEINDNHGHDVGDGLLKAFGQRMRLSLGESGIVARLAGDEFGVVMDRVESAEALERDVALMMEHMRQPFDDIAIPSSITCSAGIAICEGDEPITEVLRIADRAMYRAKHDGKNRYNVVHI